VRDGADVEVLGLVLDLDGVSRGCSRRACAGVLVTSSCASDADSDGSGTRIRVVLRGHRVEPGPGDRER
jgi:hypothetical protein